MKYFSELELPDAHNLYDTINMSLQSKDVILTFNWDPFLLQSRIRLAKLGLTSSFPQLFFLHGNVMVGFCEKDATSGLLGRPCNRCNQLFTPSKLLYPVENKDYRSDSFIKREWEAARHYLKGCLMFTAYGYSAPTTDKEAIELLKDGWGNTEDRDMEQTGVINRPGADKDALRETWNPFIHPHHYEILESFYDSFITKHPRRSIEAYWNQYWEAKFISNNPVPRNFTSFDELAAWYKPLVEAE